MAGEPKAEETVTVGFGPADARRVVSALRGFAGVVEGAAVRHADDGEIAEARELRTIAAYVDMRAALAAGRQ